MVKKKYSSPSKLKVKVTVDGKLRQIVFAGYNPNTKTRNFETSDPLLQEALESTKAFNWLFVVEQEWQIEDTAPEVEYIMEIVEPEKETKEAGLEIYTVATYGLAKKWLFEQGVKVNNRTTKAMAVEEAAKLGFDLKFENTKK